MAVANRTDLLRQLVRAAIVASTEVTALVPAERVFGDHPMDADSGTIACPMVIVEIDGGHGRYAGGLQSEELYVYVYSRSSSDEASQVYDAVYRALHAARLTLANVAQSGGARELQRPVGGWNNAVQGWFLRGRWRAVTAG